MESHAADSRKLMRHKRPWFSTLSAVDPTIDWGILLFVHWSVEWLDEELVETLVLDAGCWDAASAARRRSH